jgi:hypothetical protein
MTPQEATQVGFLLRLCMFGMGMGLSMATDRLFFLIFFLVTQSIPPLDINLTTTTKTPPKKQVQAKLGDFLKFLQRHHQDFFLSVRAKFVDRLVVCLYMYEPG